MRLRLVHHQKVSFAIAAAVLAASLTTAATAATRRPVAPADTQEWGNDIIRVSSADPGTAAVGPSGASIASTSGGGDDMSAVHRRTPGARTADTTPTADYCLELDLSDDSSGPYVVQLYLDTSDDESTAAVRRRARSAKRLATLHHTSPQDDTLSLTFNLDTTAAGTVLTTGDIGLIGAIYDGDDTLVASDDDSGDRISASLASGSYTLVIQGGDQLAGDYVVTASQGTCSDD